MSRLSDNDAHLHYEDGSHRWTDPDSVEGDDSWRLMVEAHVEEHRQRLAHNDPGWPGRLRKRRFEPPDPGQDQR